MKKERKEKENRRIILKALIKALIKTLVLVLGSVILTTFVIIYVLGGFDNFDAFIINNTEYIRSLMKLLLTVGVSLGPMIFISEFRDETRFQNGKISKKITEEILSKDTYVEVEPKEGYLRYYHYFFYEELSEIAQYVAILSKDEKNVIIFLKFDKYDKYIFLETVEKEKFTASYEVVEAIESTDQVI